MEIAIAIVGAVLGGGGITALYRARSQNRALDSGTLTKVTEAVQGVYEKLTSDLRVEVNRVIEREKQCRTELEDLRTVVVGLRERIDATNRRLDGV